MLVACWLLQAFSWALVFLARARARPRRYKFYEELAEYVGEELRHANLPLPIRFIASLRELDWCRDFRPATEVLHLVKPGNGLRNAPRCLSQAQKCTATFGWVPLRIDEHVE